MVILSTLGALVIAAIVAFGAYKIAVSTSFRKTVDRYQYKTVTDQDGNQIEVVVDLQDKDRN